MSQEKVSDSFQAKVLKDRLGLRHSPMILADKYARASYGFDGGEDWQYTSAVNSWTCPDGVYEVYVSYAAVAGDLNVIIDGAGVFYAGGNAGTLIGTNCWLPTVLWIVGNNGAGWTNQHYGWCALSKGWIVTSGSVISCGNPADSFVVRFRRVG